MVSRSQVLSKAEKRRKKKQEKAAAKSLKAQQQPASFAAAPSLPPSAPRVHPPTAPADPGLSLPGALMPNQSASSAPLTPAAIVTPPRGSSPQPPDPPSPAHKASQQMTHAKPESPQMTDVAQRGTRGSSTSFASQSLSFGVPVLQPPSTSSAKVQTVASAQPAVTAVPPVKADASSAPLPTAKGPHTPPEQSTARPSHSPPSLLLCLQSMSQGSRVQEHQLKNQQRQLCLRTSSSSSNKILMTINGLVREVVGGGLSMDRRYSPISQHSTRKPLQTALPSPLLIALPTPLPVPLPSREPEEIPLPTISTASINHIEYRGRLQAISQTCLPKQHLSTRLQTHILTRSSLPIGPPQSYSAAVGPASFWADGVTPLVSHKAPIAVLLKNYRGTDKHEQLTKLIKGSRPCTQYRSIRGEQLSLRTLPADCEHAGWLVCWFSSANFYTNQICALLDCRRAKQYLISFSAAMHMHQMMCSCACLNLTSLPCSSRWGHTRTHAHAHTHIMLGWCLAGPGDGDCGFRALLVAILLQVHSCGPAMGTSMAARLRGLFTSLPDWTCSHAVIAGYNSLMVSPVHKA